MPFLTIQVENPHAHNLVVGQSKHERTIDSIHTALVETSPDIKFGLAFNHTAVSVKSSGTDDALINLAVKNAECIGAGQTFVLMVDASETMPAMKALKTVPEIREIYCATSNPVEFLVVETSRGRGVMGLAGDYSEGDSAHIHFINRQ